MTHIYSWPLIFLAICCLAACATVDPFLEPESADTSPLALAKPLVPGFNAPEDPPPSPPEDSSTDPNTESQDPPTEAKDPSLLPSTRSNKPEPNPKPETQPTTTTTAPPTPREPAPENRPSRRVPPRTQSEPCNEVHQAMITSMQGEIDDLQTYYEELTDIIERHNIMKEVREKKKDLQKYKQDHRCK